MDRMTWIHADENLRELRTLELIASADMQIDISTGAGLIDNTWSVTVSDAVWQMMPIHAGHHIYCPGTEWGGPVTLVQHSTRQRAVTLQGPTWRGLLHQKRIYPPAGAGYLSFTDVDANALIASVLGSAFGSLYAAVTDPAGVTVSADFRYQSMARGLQNALRAYGLRLNVAFDNVTRRVLLSAQPINRLAGIVEISQDYGVDFTSQIGNVELANHCLALGSGELAARTVRSVYRVGNAYYLNRPDSLPEADVRTVLLDYPNAEDEDELIKSAIERLQEAAPAQSIAVNELAIGVEADLGDIIPVRDRVTGLTADSEVINKILNISNGRTAVQMKVGNLNMTEGGN